MASTALCPYDTGLQGEAGFDIRRSSEENYQQGRQETGVGASMDLKLLANWSLFRATCSQIRSGGKRLKETGLYPKQFAETVVHFHIGHKVGFQIRVVVYI